MVNEHGGLAKIDHDNHDMSKSWCKSQETNWDFTLHSTGSWDCTELWMWPIRIGNLSNTNMDLASLMSKKWLFRILFVKLILSLIFEHLFWGGPPTEQIHEWPCFFQIPNMLNLLRIFGYNFISYFFTIFLCTSHLAQCQTFAGLSDSPFAGFVSIRCIRISIPSPGFTWEGWPQRHHGPW